MPTTGGLQLESYEDRGREEDEVITDMPFAGPSSLLFLRYAWPVNCVSHGWPSWYLKKMSEKDPGHIVVACDKCRT